MTQRSSSSATVKAPLTDLENAVMRVVWDSGPCRSRPFTMWSPAIAI